MTSDKYKNRIKMIVANKGVTNRWLAEKIGLSEMTISRWATNRQQPTFSQLVEVARIFSIDIRDIIEADFDLYSAPSIFRFQSNN